MEARLFRAALIAASVSSIAASYRTQNFIITAATPQLAKAVGDAAEEYRRDLAEEWLGQVLPPWSDPCPVTVNAGPVGAGGATSFVFVQQQPRQWTMTIQGTPQRILDSVLPHEVTHTVFATHFGRPLPRWADEGACTTVEHESERKKQEHLLIEFLTTGRGIAFNRMFAMTEYPNDILPLYSQGYSLARYLIAQGGKRTFVRYVGDGMAGSNWTAATKRHYGFSSLSELQLTWVDWVRRGYPAVSPSGGPSGLDPETAVALAGPAEEAERPGAATESPAPSDGLAPVPNSEAVLPQEDASVPLDDGRSLQSSADHQGWYQRVYDERSRQGGAPSTADQRSTVLPLRGDHRGDHPLPNFTRPQPLSRLQPQVILEWAPPQGPPAPATAISQPPVRLAVGGADAGSQWR